MFVYCTSTFELFPFAELKSAVAEISIIERKTNASTADYQVFAVDHNRALMPASSPTLPPMRYLSWGFPDRSLRLYSMDLDKVCLHIRLYYSYSMPRFCIVLY